MTKQITGENVVLKNVRLAYAQNLYTPRPIVGGDPKYSVMAMFKPDSDAAKALKAAVTRVSRATWGTDDPPEGARQPVRWGPSENKRRMARGKTPVAELDADGGMLFCSPWCGQSEPPGLIDAWGRPMTTPGDIYSGCFAHVAVRVFNFDSGENFGVAMKLQHVMFAHDGERLDGRPAATDVFGDLISKDAPPPRETPVAQKPVESVTPEFVRPAATVVDFDDEVPF